MVKFYTLLMIFSLGSFMSCEMTENEATVFNVTDFKDPLIGTQCSLEKDEDVDDAVQIAQCEAQQDCQPVLDNGNNYMGCIPVIPEEEGSGGEEGSSGSGGEEGSSGSGGEEGSSGSGGEEGSSGSGSEGEGELEEYACTDPAKKNFKVLVCHQNNGKKKHVTICIAKQAWINAHKNNFHHDGEDYLGTCQQADLQSY